MSQVKRRIKQFFMAGIFIVIIILGWVYPMLGYFIPLCMLLGIAIGLFRGRKWCDWACPRGSFYDILVKPLSPEKEIPPLLKSMKFRISVFLILILVMAVNLIKRWPDLSSIGAFFVILLTITTILGVILALIFHQRSWCSFCPIGTLVNIIGKNKYPLWLNSDLCAECKLCSQVCPIQIKPYLYKGEGRQLVKDADCLKCNLCIGICPIKALK
jgi:polyferredoxin